MRNLKALGIETYDLKSAIKTDDRLMTATCVFATSTCRDRQGDVLECSGIDTSNHRLNPLVLLDHGLSYPLPIGKTLDQAGQYTVTITPDEAIQTTFFSQTSEVAEQTYRLISEKILIANSIGWRPIEVEKLQSDNEGHQKGLWIKRCELLEVSWVGLPANQECVQTIIDTGMIGDKTLAPAIKSLLAPYKLPRKSWSRGVDTTMKEYETMSATDEAHGGAVREDEQHEEHKEEDKKPLGSTLLSDLHKRLKELHEEHSDNMNMCENDKVKKCMAKVLDTIHKHLDDVAETHNKEYPEHDKLEHDGKDDEPEEETKDDEPEEETKTLKALVKQVVAEVLDTKVEDEDTNEIAKIERAISRREKLLAGL